jgi:hypothetical protein
MTSLKDWLKEHMGDEYDSAASPADNVESLVEEVQHFRDLMRTLKTFTEDLIDWTETYEDKIGWIDDAEILHKQPTEPRTSEKLEQRPVNSRS